MGIQNPIRQGLAVAVILLFIGVAFSPTINAEIKSNESSCTNFLDDGTLSGYVYDNNMEPIEEALVRVYFHETYEEDHTDSSGYYHVTNIPICYCMKNCTASKEDYVTEWIYLSIGENTTYNFVLESDDSDLVEFDVEFCGLGKKHTVQLTQQEAEEVELLFDDIEQQLSEVETREEAEIIFKEAVVELDKYGLLGGLSVRQVQRFITSKHLIPRNNYPDVMSDDENYFCLIAGRLTNTHFFRPLAKHLLSDYFSDNFFDLYIILQLLYIFYMFSDFITLPLRLYSSISIGNYHEFYDWIYRPAEGFVFTGGLNGIKVWSGELFGMIDWIILMPMDMFYLGAEGFTGIKVRNPLTGITSFIGKARHVKIDYW